VPKRLNAQRLPIRAKLALAFAGVIAVMLAAIGVFLYFNFKSGLDYGIDQALRARAGDLTTLVRQQGGPARLSDARPLVERGETFAQILDTRGRVLQASPGLGRRSLLTAAELAAARRSPVLMNRAEQSRLLAQAVRVRGFLIVVVGASLDQRDNALETFTGALLIGGPLALLLASAAGYGLASSALRPVESMRRRAATISAANPEARLPLPEARDEIRRLGSTLNEMLDRLERAFAHERAFVSDASHELRTPLAILKTEIEVALLREKSNDDLRAALRLAGEETDRLVLLAEDLLVISRADQGQLPVRRELTRVEDLFEIVARRFALRGRAAQRKLVFDEDDGLYVNVDRARIEQALANLVDNALRHGQGDVRLTTTVRDGVVELHVTDDGEGFPATFLARAFERFSRPDAGRSGDGAGLGLAIVAAIARAHGGDAHAANRTGRSGADVWFTLPGEA